MIRARISYFLCRFRAVRLSKPGPLFIVAVGRLQSHTLLAAGRRRGINANLAAAVVERARSAGKREREGACGRRSQIDLAQPRRRKLLLSIDVDLPTTA